MAFSMHGRQVLITGANGFIGRHLSKALTAQGAAVSILDLVPARDHPQKQHYVGDLRDAHFVDRALEQSSPEFIFHLAAFKERTSAIEAFSDAISVNLMGSLNIFTAAKKLRNLRSLVVIGTAEEYGSISGPFQEEHREAPINAYSFSKLCVTHLSEVLHRIYNIPSIVIRPTLAYGPGQDVDMFLPALIKTVLQDQPFPMTPGRQTRDFIYVSDLVEALLHAATAPGAAGQVVNIGSGQSVPLGDLAQKIERDLGKSGLVLIGAKEYRIGEVMEYGVDIGKAKELLHWTPKVGLEEGIRDTIRYYRDGR